MVGRTVAAFFLSFFGGLDQTARFIQQADAVVGEQDEFTVGFFTNGRYDGLLPMAFSGREGAFIVVCPGRLNDCRTEQAMMPVVAQVAKGI